jgi:hypothetical protein
MRASAARSAAESANSARYLQPKPWQMLMLLMVGGETDNSL